MGYGTTTTGAASPYANAYEDAPVPVPVPVPVSAATTASAMIESPATCGEG
jgi:hypothetical protein